MCIYTYIYITYIYTYVCFQYMFKDCSISRKSEEEPTDFTLGATPLPLEAGHEEMRFLVVTVLNIARSLGQSTGWVETIPK